MRKTFVVSSALLLVLVAGTGRLALPGSSQGQRGGFSGGGFSAPGTDVGAFLGATPVLFSRLNCSAQDNAPHGGNRPSLYVREAPISDRFTIPKTKEKKFKSDIKLEGTILDESGKPASAVEIHLLGLDSPQDFWGCTDAKGRYSVSVVAGNYTACVLYQGQIGLCRDFALSKDLTAKNDLHLKFFTGTNPDGLLARLPPKFQSGLFGRLRGVVYDENGKPVEGIEVRVSGQSLSRVLQATTDSHGEYSITTAPGDYVACVIHKGAAGLCREFRQRQGRIVQSDFDLKEFR
jgi:hypothetical protein